MAEGTRLGAAVILSLSSSVPLSVGLPNPRMLCCSHCAISSLPSHNHLHSNCLHRTRSQSNRVCLGCDGMEIYISSDICAFLSITLKQHWLYISLEYYPPQLTQIKAWTVKLRRKIRISYIDRIQKSFRTLKNNV